MFRSRFARREPIRSVTPNCHPDAVADACGLIKCGRDLESSARHSDDWFGRQEFRLHTLRRAAVQCKSTIVVDDWCSRAGTVRKVKR